MNPKRVWIPLRSAFWKLLHFLELFGFWRHTMSLTHSLSHELSDRAIDFSNKFPLTLWDLQVLSPAKRKKKQHTYALIEAHPVRYLFNELKMPWKQHLLQAPKEGVVPPHDARPVLSRVELRRLRSLARIYFPDYEYCQLAWSDWMNEFHSEKKSD